MTHVQPKKRTGSNRKGRHTRKRTWWVRGLYAWLEFKTNAHSNSLQKKLSKDVKEVREEKNFFVKADKTTNYYKTEPRVDYMYVTLVNKNV